jgi:hypothetical protein
MVNDWLTYWDMLSRLSIFAPHAARLLSRRNILDWIWNSVAKLELKGNSAGFMRGMALAFA